MSGVFLNPDAVIQSLGLAPGMQVADLSVGSGHSARAAARAVGARGSVWVVGTHGDLLSMVQKSARAEGLDMVEVMRGNIEVHGGSNLPSSSFDVVLLLNTLFTVPEPYVLAREISRILKPSGHALIIDWQDSFGGMGPHPNQVISSRAALEMFEQADFMHVADTPAGDYHWGFLVRKSPPLAAQ